MKNSLNNKSMSLLLWRKSNSGEDEVSMYSGILRIKNKNLVFERGNKNIDFILQDKWVERVKEVPENLKKDLGDSDYHLSLSLSECEGDNGFSKTGLKWID